MESLVEQSSNAAFSSLSELIYAVNVLPVCFLDKLAQSSLVHFHISRRIVQCDLSVEITFTVYSELLNLPDKSVPGESADIFRFYISGDHNQQLQNCRQSFQPDSDRASAQVAGTIPAAVLPRNRLGVQMAFSLLHV